MKLDTGKTYIILMIIFEILTQFFLQKGVNKSFSLKNTNMIIGVLLGFFINVFYFLVLKSGYSLAIANTLIDGGGAVGIILLGYIIFKQILSKKEILGVVITMLGVMILAINE